MKEKLIKLIRDYKEDDTLQIDEGMDLIADLDFTSIELYSLVGEIEEAFDVEFTDKAMAEIKTFGQLLSYVEKQ